MSGGYFMSLGQTVYADQVVLSSLNVGDYVGVSGALLAPGEMASYQTFKLADQYVPGATEVFVTGLPTAVDTRRGTTQLGNLLMQLLR